MKTTVQKKDVIGGVNSAMVVIGYFFATMTVMTLINKK